MDTEGSDDTNSSRQFSASLRSKNSSSPGLASKIKGSLHSIKQSYSSIGGFSQIPDDEEHTTGESVLVEDDNPVKLLPKSKTSQGFNREVDQETKGSNSRTRTARASPRQTANLRGTKSQPFGRECDGEWRDGVDGDVAEDAAMPADLPVQFDPNTPPRCTSEKESRRTSGVSFKMAEVLITPGDSEHLRRNNVAVTQSPEIVATAAEGFLTPTNAEKGFENLEIKKSISTASIASPQKLTGNENSAESKKPSVIMPLTRSRKQSVQNEGPRRLSLGGALCIPSPPRTSDDMSLKKLLLLAYSAVGVIYGDVGVSPMYVLKTIFDKDAFVNASPGEREMLVVGALSVIFWTMTIAICVKYMIFVLLAEKNGEGGTFALVSLLPTDDKIVSLRTTRLAIYAAMAGASFMLADSIINPAIAVLAAFEGVKTYHPPFEVAVVPSSIVLLSAVFYCQKWGKSKTGILYSPVMVVWFLVLFAIGIYNIAAFPAVLHQTLNPWSVIVLAMASPNSFLLALSTATLTVSGCEAIYADLGHYKRRPIRVSWFFLVYPCLVLNYCGQGAYLLGNHDALADPFYHSVPWALQWPVVILACIASVVASQSMISGCFSLLDQAISLNVFPKVSTVQTPNTGGVYIPSINFVMWAGSMILILIFTHSDNLANIYAVTISMDMMITSILYTMVMHYTWSTRKWRIVSFAIVFYTCDIALFCASLKKIATGGGIPLIFAFAVIYLMFTWYKTANEIKAHLQDSQIGVHDLKLHVRRTPRSAGMGVFVASYDEDVPMVLQLFAQRFPCLPEAIVCLNVYCAPTPFIAEEERIIFRAVDGTHGIYKLVVQYGYAERQIDTIGALEKAKKRGIRMRRLEAGETPMVTFVVRNDGYSSKAQRSWWQMIRIAMYDLLHRNASSTATYLNLPPNDYMEIGTQLVL